MPPAIQGGQSLTPRPQLHACRPQPILHDPHINPRHQFYLGSQFSRCLVIKNLRPVGTAHALVGLFGPLDNHIRPPHNQPRQLRWPDARCCHDLDDRDHLMILPLTKIGEQCGLVIGLDSPNPALLRLDLRYISASRHRRHRINHLPDIRCRFRIPQNLLIGG